MKAAALLLSLELGAASAVAREGETPSVISRRSLLEAMRLCRGYNAAATTNGARFQAEVLLRLVRAAQARDPQGPPLLIGHGDWFAALLEVTGLPADKAPAFAALADRYGQDIEVEYRPDRVIAHAEADSRPAVAVNVRITWPEGPNAAKEYSYEDNLSTPRLKVTNNRVITYRLLDFGDMVVFDQIEGLTGRPTSGMLGLLFRLIGEGHVVEFRMAFSPDGLQVSRGRAKKLFEVATTVTVYPDGRTEKDLPPDRPDLRALEARLKRPLRISYRPLR